MARYINRFHEMEDVISDKAAVQQAGYAELTQIQETIKQQGKMLESISRKISEWAKKTGISKGTLRRRIVELGWNAEKALTTRVRVQNKKQP